MARHPDRAPILCKFVRLASFRPTVQVVVKTERGLYLTVDYALLEHAVKWPVLVLA